VFAKERLIESVEAPTALQSLSAIAERVGDFLARVDVVDISYIDDAVVPVFSDAKGLADRTGRVASIARDVFATHSMLLNFAPGKSEAILAWYGAGSIGTKRDFQRESGGVIQCQPRKCDAFSLRVVDAYKHVGTKTVAAATSDTEAAQRACIIRSETRALRERVLSNMVVSVERRMTVLQLHILLFQAGAWASLSPKALRRIHAAVMFAYRIVADAAYSGTAPTLTDQEVLRLTKAVAPINLLRLARILLLIRVCAKAPAYTIATIMIAAQAKTSWLFSASMDIDWACVHYEPLASNAAWTITMWMDAFCCEPQKYKRLFSDACRSTAANVVASWATTATLSPLANHWLCDQCEKACATKQALSVHRWRKHGMKRYERLLVSTTFCEICLLEFHSRQRLLNHVAEKSDICRQCYHLLGPKLTLEQANEMDAYEAAHSQANKAKGLPRHQAKELCFRLQGPLHPVVAPFTVHETGCHHPLGIGRRWHQ